jgi:hypothetical protein
MEKNQVIGIGLGGLVVAVALMIVAVWADQNHFGLRVAVLFEDVQGLEQGNAVILNGKQIGTVAKLEMPPPRQDGKKWEVTLNIDSQYKNHLKKTSMFYIQQNATPGVEGIMALHVKTCDCDAHLAPALTSGETVLGVDSWMKWKLGCAAHCLWETAEDVLDGTLATIEGIQQDLGDYLESPDGRKLRQQTDQLAKSITEVVKAGGERLNRELPGIIEDMDELARSLRESGHEEEARQIEREKEKLLEEKDRYDKGNNR